MTRRPFVHRSVLTAALTAALSLAACSSDSADKAPTSATPSAHLPAPAAAGAVDKVVKASTTAIEAGEAGKADRSATFVGKALTAADARATILPKLSAGERAAYTLTADPPTVLAISRAGSESRQVIARATLAESKMPVLMLLTSQDGSPDFKIAAMARMLPGARVGDFEQLSVGSRPLNGADGLVAEPTKILSEWAASMTYPNPATPTLLGSDDFSKAVRDVGDRTAKGLEGRGGFVQEQRTPELLGGLRLSSDNGALVFGVVERVEMMAFKTPQAFTPSVPFTALSKLTSVTTEAQLSTSQFVVVHIPKVGQATVVAASDQLVSASGR